MVQKEMGKLYPKRLLNKEINKPGYKFNPRLALIGLRTTGHCFIAGEPQWTPISLPVFIR